MRDKENYQLGFVLWFDNDKGFGKIKSIENITAFLHVSTVSNEVSQILKGNSFLFSYKRGKKGWTVTNAKIPHSTEDFFFGINQLIKTPNAIEVEVTISGKSRWGNPYKRREMRDIDTFYSFLRKIAENKTVQEMAELFKQAFNQNYITQWNKQDLLTFYGITKRVFPKLKFAPSNDVVNFSLTQRDDIANELINYYDSNLTIQDKFENLKNQLSKPTSSSRNKKTIDFEIDYLVANKEELATEQTANLINQFDLPDTIIKKLVNPYFTGKISDIGDLNTCLTIFDSLDSDLRKIYFNNLIDSLTDELYFKIWKEKKLFIDFKNHKFEKYWGYNSDYTLPKDIIQSQLENIGINEIIRIQQFHQKDEELLYDFIESFLERKYSIHDFQRLLTILESKNNSVPPDTLNNILQTSLNLHPDLIKKIGHSDRIRLYRIFPDNLICKSIFENVELKAHYLLSIFKSIPYSKDIGTIIINRLENEKAPISAITACFSYLKVNEHSFPIDLLIENVKANINAFEIFDVLEFADSFNDTIKNQIESALADSLIDMEIPINERHLNLIELNSPIILKSYILKRIRQLNVENEKKELYSSYGKKILELLFQNPSTPSINDDVFEEYISLFLAGNEIQILEYVLLNRIVLYNKLLSKLPLTKNTIVEIIPQFETSIEYLKPHLKNNNPFYYIFNIVANKDSFRVTEELNLFFQKYNYQFQSILLKYFIREFKQNRISKNKFFIILNKMELKELAAILIRVFISNQINARDKLMELMNIALKSHFTILNELDDSDKDNFKNIFSIESLVNHCDGRKHYGGLTTWRGDNQIRYYSNGNNPIIIGAKENIYCEGRFWKNVRFYDSNSNRQLNNSNEFYWCRNKVCVGVNKEVNLNKSFHEWNLNEINEIFQLNLDRLAFIHLAGWLNRMETIFLKLSCYECKLETPDIVYHPRRFKVTMAGRTKVTHLRRAKVDHL